MKQAKTKFRELIIEKPIPKSSLLRKVELSFALNRLTLKQIEIIDSRDQQIKIALKACNSIAKYKDISWLRNNIKRFLKEVDKAKQPISRIHDLVQDAHKHRGVNTKIIDLSFVLQVHNRLLATVLLLRCDYAILSDFVTHDCDMASSENLGNVCLNLAPNRKDCENLMQESRSRQQSTHEVKGLLYWARFVALERSRSASLSNANTTTLVDRARDRLHLARTICNTNPGQTASMSKEVFATEKMLGDSTFYASVTNVEKATMYAAMAQSF